MTDKSVHAFRTISEVAEELDLPQHVLRFWETRFNQIRPMKRGGGRRYYRPDDVDLLRGIRYLLYTKGFTIRGVQRILKQNGPRFVVAVGSGDLAALDAIQSSRAAPASAKPGEAHVGDADLIAAVAEPEDQPADPDPDAASLPPLQESEERRSLAGFLKRGRGNGDASQAGSLPVAARKALDDVVLELLECKRLLDQVR